MPKILKNFLGNLKQKLRSAKLSPSVLRRRKWTWRNKKESVPPLESVSAVLPVRNAEPRREVLTVTPKKAEKVWPRPENRIRPKRNEWYFTLDPQVITDETDSSFNLDTESSDSDSVIYTENSSKETTVTPSSSPVQSGWFPSPSSDFWMSTESATNTLQVQKPYPEPTKKARNTTLVPLVIDKKALGPHLLLQPLAISAVGFDAPNSQTQENGTQEIELDRVFAAIEEAMAKLNLLATPVRCGDGIYIPKPVARVSFSTTPQQNISGASHSIWMDYIFNRTSEVPKKSPPKAPEANRASIRTPSFNNFFRKSELDEIEEIKSILRDRNCYSASSTERKLQELDKQQAFLKAEALLQSSSPYFR